MQFLLLSLLFEIFQPPSLRLSSSHFSLISDFHSQDFIHASATAGIPTETAEFQLDGIFNSTNANPTAFYFKESPQFWKDSMDFLKIYQDFKKTTPKPGYLGSSLPEKPGILIQKSKLNQKQREKDKECAIPRAPGIRKGKIKAIKGRNPWKFQDFGCDFFPVFFSGTLRAAGS